MGSVEVSPHDVERALRAIRRQDSLVNSPLIDLEVVRRRMQGRRYSESQIERSGALQDLLREIVVRELKSVRNGSKGATTSPSEDARAQLACDFQIGNVDLEKWSAVYFGYFVIEHRRLGATLRPLAITYDHYRKRAERGIKALSEALERENLKTADDESPRPVINDDTPAHKLVLEPQVQVAREHRYVVGRGEEVRRFRELIEGRRQERVHCIFGPGGIGKSVVARKLYAEAATIGLPRVLVDGGAIRLSPIHFLRAAVSQLSGLGIYDDALSEFTQADRDLAGIDEVLFHLGPRDRVFDQTGRVLLPAAIDEALSNVAWPVSEQARLAFQNRFALERYIRATGPLLVAHFGNAVAAINERSAGPLVFVVDTYEQMESLDEWMFLHLVPVLRGTNTRVIVLGRNRLSRVNFEWATLETAMDEVPLGELSLPEAREYLAHHGLDSESKRESVLSFTGGYPLLLLLVVQLSRESGGWSTIDGIESSADREWVAGKLLERILQEERVHDVRAFLEKGSIVRWFDPAIVGAVLQVDDDRARELYDLLKRHSFVERHPFGLKFHDKIHEILRERLKFNSTTYQLEQARLSEWFATQHAFGADEKVTIL